MRLNNIELKHKVTKFIEGVYPPNTKVEVTDGIIYLTIPDVKKENLQTSTMLSTLADSLDGVVIIENNENILLFTEQSKKEIEDKLIELNKQRMKLDQEFRLFATDMSKTIEDGQEIFEQQNKIAREILKLRNKLQTFGEALDKKELDQAKVVTLYTNIEEQLEEMVEERLEQIKASLTANDKEDLLDDVKEGLPKPLKHYIYYGIGGVHKESKSILDSVYKTIDKFIESKKQVLNESETSNEILDKKYIWLFHIVDSEDNIIADYIDNIEEAISYAIEENGKLIVANPYEDPNPEDKNAELVFVDEIGPIIVYNAEEVTIPKKEVSSKEQGE